MQVFLDTNILIATFISSHEHHPVAFTLYQKILSGKLKAAMSTHNLAEFFAIFSVYPQKPTPSHEQIEYVLQENVLKHLGLIDLTKNDYLSALKRVKEKKLRSGAIYDALHYQAALKAKAKTFYTLNINAFERLSAGEIKISLP